MEAKQKAPSPMVWVLGQTGVHKGQYVLSVVLAVLGVAFSIAPYFVVARIAAALMAGQRDLSFYLTQCAVMAALWLCRAGRDPQALHGKAHADAAGRGTGAELRRTEEHAHRAH